MGNNANDSAPKSTGKRFTKGGAPGPGRPRKGQSKPSALDLNGDLLDLVETVVRESLATGNQDTKLKSQRIALALVALKNRARGKVVVADPVVMQLVEFAFKVHSSLPPVADNGSLKNALKGFFAAWTPPEPAPPKLEDNANKSESFQSEDFEESKYVRDDDPLARSLRELGQWQRRSDRERG
jgi:hypothetical protein